MGPSADYKAWAASGTYEQFTSEGNKQRDEATRCLQPEASVLHSLVSQTFRESPPEKASPPRVRRLSELYGDMNPGGSSRSRSVPAPRTDMEKDMERSRGTNVSLIAQGRHLFDFSPPNEGIVSTRVHLGEEDCEMW